MRSLRDIEAANPAIGITSAAILDEIHRLDTDPPSWASSNIEGTPTGVIDLQGWRLTVGSRTQEEHRARYLRDDGLSPDAFTMRFSDMSDEAEAELAAWRGILDR